MVIEFRLLGTVEMRVDGHAVDVGHARQQCVLAALLMSANTATPVEQLVDRAWGDQLPQRSRATVHTYTSRLRKVLGPGRLALRPGGYHLSLGPAELDLAVFRSLVADAAKASDDRTAAGLLDRALALWRGPAFGPLDTPWINSVRHALHAERLAAELDSYDLALRLGRHHQVLGALTLAAAEHPWDERIAGQLMLALYRCGRPTDALAAYRRLRERLAEELGTDPGPPLRQLHQQMLRDDPKIAAPGHAPVPRQLPGSPAGFTGRGPELAALDQVIADAGDSPAIAVVTGGGGMGKTWLALRWADASAARFPDGQLYANLRGYDPTGDPVGAAMVVRGFLDALGVEPARIPLDLDAQAGLYRTLLAGQRVLVVLDNARDTASVLPLLPGAAGCAVVVTSRHPLNALVVSHGARPLTVGVLPDADARAVLLRGLGRPAGPDDEAALRAVADHCAGLPLALGIAAARIAARPDVALSVLSDELRTAATRLDVLDAGELSVNLRAVLAASTDALTPAALSLFARLGLAPGTDIGLAAVASLAGQPADKTRDQLDELVAAHLVASPEPDRYRLHDLIRLYSMDLHSMGHRSVGHYSTTSTMKPPGDAAEERLRLYDHYLHTAHRAALLLSPHREPLALAEPLDGVTVVPLADLDEAMAWFTTEHPALLATIRDAAATGADAYAHALPWTLATYFDRRGHWRDWAAAQHVSVAAAQRLGDDAAQAGAHRLLANAYSNLRAYGDALAHLEQALALFDAHDDDAGRAHTHFDIALLHDRQSRPADALPHAARSRDGYRAVGNQLGEAVALNAIGWYHTQLGAHAEAVDDITAALALTRATGSRYGEANTLDSLGYAYHHLGRHGEAIEAYRVAIALFRDIGDSHAEALVLDHLGDSLHAVAADAEARDAWTAALTVLDALDHPDAAQVREKLASAR